MPIEQLVLLAVIQGITEFLPISSSAHLILAPALLGWTDQGPMIDVSVHVGSLVAVLVYFWRDMVVLSTGLGHLLRGRYSAEARLLAMLVLASLPVLAAGAAIVTLGVADRFRSLEVIAWTNLVFAVLLWTGDSMGLTIRRMEHTGVAEALLVGLAQMLALVPGVSRAGVTMTMARFLGYERPDAARLSTLLAVPTILALGVATAFELGRSGDLALQRDALLAAGMSCVAALVAIWAMMAILKRTTMFVFVAYRIVLGTLLLAVVYELIPVGGNLPT